MDSEVPQDLPVSTLTNPQEDADRIRLKRLAKLTAAQSSAAGPSTLASPKPKPIVIKPATPQPTPVFHTPKPTPNVNRSTKFNSAVWESTTIEIVLGVTLNRGDAEKSGGRLVYLQDLADEMGPTGSAQLSESMVDQLLISRLEYPTAGTAHDMTSFAYLTACWKRLETAKSALVRRGYSQAEVAQGMTVISKLKDLIVSYAGLSLQEPSMFYQPHGVPAGAEELIEPLLGLTNSSPFISLSFTPTAADKLEPSDLEPFLSDLAARFDGEDTLKEILAPVIDGLVQLVRDDRGGLAGTGTERGWRAAIAGLEGLCAVKPIASLMTELPGWNPHGITSAFIEHLSYMGPPARLSVFGREWPSLAQAYFSEPQKRTQSDVQGSNTTLRTTLHALQQSLFTIFNAAVRSGATGRENTLNYLANALNLNLRRGGTHVDPATVASDGYMVNLQTVLLRFAEPFLDAKFSKIDKVDPLYFVHSDRLNISEETRIKATLEEVKALAEQSNAMVVSPNFISEIFFLTAAFNHYGYVRTLSAHESLGRNLDDLTRHIERTEADQSYVGTPAEPRVRAAIQKWKTEKDRMHEETFAYQVQLLDPDIIFRMIGYTTFMMTWLIRLVDPSKSYPASSPALPLPKTPPAVFITLPEYFIEDIVEFYFFLVRYSPGSIELSGKKELVEFIIIFLTSTWYIKNPHLKARLVQILFYGTLAHGRDRMGVLGPVLNSHPLALQYLVPSLMKFYVEVEHTGASSQFYDKFDARRNIAYVLKNVWNNPDHRKALDAEVVDNMDNFIRFANLLMNDCTYLLDESLSKLAEIYRIQNEMASESWDVLTAEEKAEKTKALQSAEGQATSYSTLGKSTVALLKDFTAQAKAPFMMAEIVDRLAAMLDYNLEALAGPKCANLKVKNMDKYRFEPRRLLSDIFDIYVNLSDQSEFVRAVASEGRSYNKNTFERAAGIVTNKALKSSTEVEQFVIFVGKVEETRLLIEAEDDLGDIPDEFLDPLMYTLMRDPVKLPSSKTTIDRSTIKSHLLSDPTDPFNRSPLSIDDVVPDTELQQKIMSWLAQRKKSGMDLREPSVSPSVETNDMQTFDEP